MVTRHTSHVTRQKKNLAKLLKQRLPGRIFGIIRKIGNLAQAKGLPAYIVGGFVRDALLGVKNLDLDIVVEGKAIDFTCLLKGRIAEDIVLHPRFGTATLTLPCGFKIDIATSRKEHYACAAALPTVYASRIREDLFRRDFTINTLAVKINKDNFGQLLDLFGGQNDLREKNIRVLHPQSFIDDPTRILRAVRFEQRYNFTIEKDTARLLRQATKEGMLKKLSKFRIGNELILILREEEPLKSLVRISALCRGLSFIHPSIRLGRIMLEQLKSAKDSNSWLVYFMLLTAGVNISQVKRLCRAFSLTKANTQKIVSFKENSDQALKAIEKAKSLSSRQIYQILHPFSYEETLALICRSRSKRARARFRLFLKELSQVKIGLTGKDLKRLKIKPGPRYTNILQDILYAKIDGKVKTKSDELNYVRDLLN